MHSWIPDRVKNLSKGLLDTSAIIELESAPEIDIPDEPFISAVTLAELAIGPYITSDARERSKRQRRLQEVEARFDALPFDSTAARDYAALVAASVAAGRKAHRRRALDFMIAATARAAGLPLYTRNPSGFEGLEDLVEIVTVH